MKIRYLAPLVVLFFLLAPSTKADFMTEEQQTIATSQKLLAATVKIEPEAFTKGTGFYVSSGTILTNEHVIHKESGDTVKVTRYDGTTCTARISYREEGTDLAILHANCQSNAVLTLTEGYKIGQSILVMGNPGSFDFTLSKGIVSATRWDRVQFDARVDFGSSGGVMADLNGNVIGVVTEKAKTDNYVGMAIPENRIRQFLSRAGVTI